MLVIDIIVVVASAAEMNDTLSLVQKWLDLLRGN